MPITKYSYIVKDVRNLADTIRNAFRIAKSGRPGPVLIDIPKDVTAAVTGYKAMEPAVIKRETKDLQEKDIYHAVDMIKDAKKPFIMVGGGATLSNASSELKKFVEKVNAPVCDTLMGKGAFNGTHPLYTGMVGMHGTKASNFGISECDLLITIGARFSDRVLGNPKRFAKDAKILQIDIDPAEINKNIVVDSCIIGDIKAVLTLLNRRLVSQDHKEWIDYIQNLKEKYPLTYQSDVLSGPQVVEKIYEKTQGDAIIVTEVGQHQMWAAQFYSYHEPRKFLTSGGLGTMGYGLGAALGAKMGRKDELVINIAGDGCFRMNINELATAARYQIPVIQVVINNQVLGMVRQWQNLFYEERYSYTTLKDGVDFIKVAEGFGVDGRHVSTIEEFEAAFDEAVASKKPFVIDCHIDSDEKVWPMVSPGSAISEAFTEEDLANK